MYDVVVVGAGPAGATAAEDLVRSGYKVALLEREGRIKPCVGAIPPRLLQDFHIGTDQLLSEVKTARIVSPKGRTVDIPIENGFVGMVDRKDFDPFLRRRAVAAGADYFVGTFVRIKRDPQGANPRVVFRDKATCEESELPARLIIGADGARSRIGQAEVPGADTVPLVYAYHEVVEAPKNRAGYDPQRCDVIYDGAISPDFYGWVFPHGGLTSVGVASEDRDVDLRAATAALRDASGLADCRTLRKVGAPIPLRPLACWDNGRDVVLAGDAAGVVAPSSGEGIYYAMVCGRAVATACAASLASGRARDLKLARSLFMREHKTAFRVLASLRNAYYRSDNRRERFVSLCHDIDVQRLTFEAYVNKTFVKSRPLARLKIGLKALAHLTGIVSSERT